MAQEDLADHGHQPGELVPDVGSCERTGIGLQRGRGGVEAELVEVQQVEVEAQRLQEPGHKRAVQPERPDQLHVQALVELLVHAGEVQALGPERPRELEDAARVEGCNFLGVLWRVYVPLARPTYLAYGLVSVSYHWNNFLWPLVVTNTVNTRPLTVGLAIFGAPESGVDWGVISAGTLMAVAPLLIAFLLFQRQFMQSFMQAGIK